MSKIYTESFLSGGGEMGVLMRSKDWSLSKLGNPANWPQSLRTTLSIILNSKFPMFLFWGSDQNCFYNDAYRPSLGKTGKHPNILGICGKDAWPEIWHLIKPMIDQVMDGGESTWSENSLIPIYRNGKIEDVYWTFSYSPVHDETGHPAGVFVTCCETTKNINKYKKLKDSHTKFQNSIMQAPVGIVILTGHDFMVETSNDFYLNLIDKTKEEFIGKTLFTTLPEVEDVIRPILLNVLRTGHPFYGNEFEIVLKRGGKKEKCFFNFVYQPLQQPGQKLLRIMVVVSEVTSTVMARRKMEAKVAKVENMFESSQSIIYSYSGIDAIESDTASAQHLRKTFIKNENKSVSAINGKNAQTNPFDGFVTNANQVSAEPYLSIAQQSFLTETNHHRHSRLYIKNMVSARCKMIVKAELEKMGLNAILISSGVVKMGTKLSETKHEELRTALLKFGLELIDVKKSELIEKTKKIIIEMVHYMDVQPSLKFSVYLSENLKYNYTALSRIFSEVQGTTIEQFIISHKIERVKDLLVYDELSLAEIAFKLHYSSAAHLSNQFKKVTGLTPKYFKKLRHKRLMVPKVE